MVINTNIPAQAIANLRGDSSRQFAYPQAKSHPGPKPDSTEEAAEGQTDSMQFEASIGQPSPWTASLDSAVAFCQTQEGFLGRIGKALERMSELATRAQDRARTSNDRSLYNHEFQALAAYIRGVAAKDFNGASLFSAAGLEVATDSAGSTFTMPGISANYLGSPSTTPLPMPAMHLGETAAPSGFGDAGASLPQTNGMLIAVGLPTVAPMPITGAVTMTDSPAQPACPGTPDISTLDGAKSAAATIQSAGEQLARDQAVVSATIAQLNAASEQQRTLTGDPGRTGGRIQDVEVARESAEFVRHRILVQSDTAMLTQAHAAPSSILRLLS